MKGLKVTGVAAILLLGIGRSVARYRATSDVAYAFACSVVVVMLVNIICLASQLAPSIVTFTTMSVLANLAFVEPPPRKGGG